MTDGSDGSHGAAAHTAADSAAHAPAHHDISSHSHAVSCKDAKCQRESEMDDRTADGSPTITKDIIMATIIITTTITITIAAIISATATIWKHRTMMIPHNLCSTERAFEHLRTNRPGNDVLGNWSLRPWLVSR